jgi:hypothetical protein
MSRAINHFMWGYQPHFRATQEGKAQSILQSLDTRFDPEVFLVGILTDGRQNRHPACVEPEAGNGDRLLFRV